MPGAADGIADRVAAALGAADFQGVAVVDGPSGRLLEVARGVADRGSGRPIDLRSRFGIASASKLFTAVAVLRLVERRDLELDGAIVDLLGPGERPATLDPGVTVRHLLTHTSGIADYYDEYGDEPYEALWTRFPSSTLRTPHDMLRLFRDLPPLAPPGAEVRYSNAAFVLLAVLLEQVSGRDFPSVVADEVFGPAGMAGSGYPALDDVVPDLAVGYLPPDRPDGAWRSNIFAIPAVGGGDGGAVCAAADLLAFLDALRDGSLLGDELLREALTPHVRDGREGWNVGLAFQILGEGRARWVGHAGEDPGYSARVRWYPEADLRLVILSNVSLGAIAARQAVEAALEDARLTG